MIRIMAISSCKYFHFFSEHHFMKLKNFFFFPEPTSYSSRRSISSSPCLCNVTRSPWVNLISAPKLSFFLGEIFCLGHNQFPVQGEDEPRPATAYRSFWPFFPFHPRWWSVKSRQVQNWLDKEPTLSGSLTRIGHQRNVFSNILYELSPLRLRRNSLMRKGVWKAIVIVYFSTFAFSLNRTWDA